MNVDIEQLLLPFAHKEYISVKRAAHILGIGYVSVLDLYAAGKIEMIEYVKRRRKRVKYSSIVGLCDRLRNQYNIKDRRPPLDNPIFRHKDEDLLPFPIADTISTREASDILGYDSLLPVQQMIREGHFDAYQISSGYPYRVSRKSLAEFIARAYSNNERRSKLRTAI